MACVALALAMIGCGSIGDSGGSRAGAFFQADNTTSNVVTPEVEGPIAGNPFFIGTSFDPTPLGYRRDEYFVSGTARSYESVSSEALTQDGVWKVAEGEEADYETRIVVFRPIDPNEFSGTVFVEWMNVSGGLDASPDWTFAHVELMRRGHAYMGVSAQFVGIEGGGGIIGLPLHLKAVNPARYGGLVHPGDSFSYDMFSQAAQATRTPDSVDPLDGIRPEFLIAMGESQSASRLVTYINAIDPLARVFDGFFVHSRLGGAAPLAQAPQEPVPTPPFPLFRSPSRVPVINLQTETDFFALGAFRTRQPDTDSFRLWEVAGSAHADLYTLATGAGDTGSSFAPAELVITADPIPGIISCAEPVNAAPQHHYVVKAAVHALERWVRGGAAPPIAPPIDVLPSDPPALARDVFGNALGGIRSPWVDAPTATLSGEGQSGICGLFGVTVPFSQPLLENLYPNRDAYLTPFLASLDAAIARGFILEDDRARIEEAAEASSIGL